MAKQSTKSSLLVEEKVRQERYEICKVCEYYTWQIKICQKCGCWLPAKTRVKSFSCPINKWGKDLSDEEK